MVSLNQPLVSPQTLSLEAPARIKNKAPSPDWPQEGEVTFENAEMRYQENLPLVLKKVSFTIKPKEKIGIVGRTGSILLPTLVHGLLLKLPNIFHVS